MIQAPRGDFRPTGARFGSLVHLVFRDASLNAAQETLLQLAQTHGRLLAASDEEVRSAAAAVFDALQHSMLTRARQSIRLHRELPVAARTSDGSVFEGVIDLAFLEGGKWIVVDFKTDVDRPGRASRYRRQVGWYMRVLEQITGVLCDGFVLHV